MKISFNRVDFSVMSVFYVKGCQHPVGEVESPPQALSC